MVKSDGLRVAANGALEFRLAVYRWVVFGALVEAVDQGADFVETVVDAVELVGERAEGMVHAIAERAELVFDLVFELVELLAREELGFDRRFAHELSGHQND